jgi:hypothetical protein
MSLFFFIPIKSWGLASRCPAKGCAAPAFVETCQRFGVETVPVVATILFDLAEVKRYSEGKTLLLDKDAHIREGLVVRPVRERSDPNIGRVILKYVSDSYLFGEKTDFTDQ